MTEARYSITKKLLDGTQLTVRGDTSEELALNVAAVTSADAADAIVSQFNDLTPVGAGDFIAAATNVIQAVFPHATAVQQAAPQQHYSPPPPVNGVICPTHELPARAQTVKGQQKWVCTVTDRFISNYNEPGIMKFCPAAKP